MHLMKNDTSNWLRAAAIFCSIAIAACDPSVGPDASEMLPKPNLTLTAEISSLDYAGKRIAGSSSTEWITISPDTSSVAGRAHVARYVSRTDTSRSTRGDTLYVHMEDDGDISLLQRFTDIGVFELPDRWVSFPIGGKGTKTTTATDTTFQRGTTTYHFKETWTSSFLGSEMLDTGATRAVVVRGDLATVKAQVVQTVEVATNLPLLTPVSTTHIIWYSPKLNAIVRYESFVTWPPVSGAPAGGGVGITTIGYRQR